MGNLEGFPFPPGLYFCPTEEQLVCYYLHNRSTSSSSPPSSSESTALFNFNLIKDLTDVYEYDPYDLPEHFGFRGGDDGDNHCYFFTARGNGGSDGLETKGGFWKITGRDQPVVAESGGMVVGLRNTLVFFKGKNPDSQITDWIMHAYVQVGDHQLERGDSTSATKDSFTLCHVFHKFDSGNKLTEHLKNCDFEHAIATVPDQQYHQGTSFSGIMEVDMQDETLVAPYDDGDELHKILMKIIDESNDVDFETPNDGAADAFQPPMDILLANQLVNFDSECPEILEGDFMELDDLLSPLADDG